MMERQGHIFDRSTNRRRLVRGLILICGLLLGLDWVLHRHTDHPWEALFSFYALYGFFACIALVLLARELRKLVMRGEDYYAAPSGDDSTGKGEDGRDA